MFYVYLYRDPSRNNEPIYVGKGKNNRSTSHLTLKKKHPFYNRIQFMKKNGVNPIIEYLFENLDESQAFVYEIEFIAKYGRKDLGLGTLLNLSNGGEGPSGHKASEETKLKMSLASKGRKKSPEACKNMSEVYKNRSSVTKEKHLQAITRSVICPKCLMVGAKPAMHRWHFGNCTKNLETISE